MGVASGSGGSGGIKPAKGKKDDDVVKHNPVVAASTTTNLGVSGTAATTSSGTKTGTKAAPVLGGSKKAPQTAAQAAASAATKAANAYTASQNKAKRQARDRYIEDADRLGGQVAALQKALGSDGMFKKALKTKLGNLDLVLGQQLGQLEQNFGERSASLDADAANNSMAAGDSTSQTDTNRARERASALSEIASQGGGESDGLRAQLMSLRAGAANQNGIDRAFHDGARSIQNSRVDLVNDSRTAMQNVWLEADADRAQLWNDFHGQQSETWTALGNAFGQQAEYLGMAKEQSGKNFLVKEWGSSSSSSSKGGKKSGKGGKKNGGTPTWEQDGGKGALGQANIRTQASSLSAGKTKKMYGSGLAGSKFQDSGGGRGVGTVKPGKLGNMMSAAETASDKAFIKAANQMGKAYDSSGLPSYLREWGPELGEPEVRSTSLLQSARTTIAQKAPEGATLRKW